MSEVVETILSPLQRDILTLLAASDTPLSQQHIANATDMSKATISTNLSDMVEAALVLKVDGVPGSARRVYGYRILPDGISALESGNYNRPTNFVSAETVETTLAAIRMAVDKLDELSMKFNFFVEIGATLAAQAETMTAERQEILEILRALRGSPEVKPQRDKSHGWKFIDYDTPEAAIEGISGKIASLKQLNNWKARAENVAGAPDFFADQVELAYHRKKSESGDKAEEAPVAEETATADNSVKFWENALLEATSEITDYLDITVPSNHAYTAEQLASPMYSYLSHAHNLLASAIDHNVNVPKLFPAYSKQSLESVLLNIRKVGRVE
jgi:biotin operon repressor